MNDFNEQTLHNLAHIPNMKIGFIINDKRKFFYYKHCLNTMLLRETNLHINETDSFYEVMNLTTNTVIILCNSKAKSCISRSHLVFTDDSLTEEDKIWSQTVNIPYYAI